MSNLRGWIDEVAQFAPPPEQDSSLAAMISTVADGKAVTGLDKAVLRLHLIDQALDRGLSWAQLGSLYGMSGPELKRDIRKLRAQVRRQQHTQP